MSFPDPQGPVDGNQIVQLAKAPELVSMDCQPIFRASGSTELCRYPRAALENRAPNRGQSRFRSYVTLS